MQKLLKLEPNQPRITNYISIPIKVQEILQHSSTKESPDVDKDEDQAFQFSTELLKKLIDNAQNNCSLVPKARRHNEIVISYSLSLLVMIGPSAYKLIHANMLEAFPSLSTVEREASKRYHPLKEGEFLFDKLAAHLDAYQATRIISISEDATRVVSRVEHDGSSDRIVGFVLPLSNDSLPQQNTLLPAHLKALMDVSKKVTSIYIYVAQAMSLNVQPFCLALIGSDNCFNATVVLKEGNTLLRNALHVA